MCSRHGASLWQMPMASWLFSALLIYWIVIETSIGEPVQGDKCLAEGESSDGYNPKDCYAFKPETGADSNLECCGVVARYTPPIPDHLKDYLSYGEQTGTEFPFTKFDYAKFVRSSKFEHILIPLAIDRDAEDAKNNEMFVHLWIYLKSKCMDNLTPEHKANGFPLLTISYDRYGSQSEKLADGCDFCRNTIYMKPDAIQNALRPASENVNATFTDSFSAFLSSDALHNTNMFFLYNKSDFGAKYGSTPVGLMCPLKPRFWSEDFGWRNYLLHHDVDGYKAENSSWAYLPLRIHKPGTVYAWDKNLIEDEHIKGRIGNTENFPCDDFFILFALHYRILVAHNTE